MRIFKCGIILGDRSTRCIGDVVEQFESARATVTCLHDSGDCDRLRNVCSVYRSTCDHERVSGAGNQRPEWCT
uniref:Uncharacterized protein n=1 Tax=Parascaris equorum TaxID=6256 RepID=A0A914RGB8_PAREQ